MNLFTKLVIRQPFFFLFAPSTGLNCLGHTCIHSQMLPLVEGTTVEPSLCILRCSHSDSHWFIATITLLLVSSATMNSTSTVADAGLPICQQRHPFCLSCCSSLLSLGGDGALTKGACVLVVLQPCLHTSSVVH